MKVTYKVISTLTGNDLTDKEDWVLQPNGRIAYNCYGDLIGDECVKAVLITDGLEEPRHGKWISASTKPGIYAGMKCSLCKARISYSEFYNGQHLYCHKCGAKMEK